MSDTGFPNKIEPGKYAEQERELQGRIAIDQLERFKGYLVDSKGFISLDLNFFKDPERIRVMAGSCRGQVQMMCERCLEACSVELNSEFELGFVFDDEQAKHLPKRYEPAFMDKNGVVELYPLLEDEAILALPMYAYHPEGSCEAVDVNTVESEPEQEASKENPFNVLSQLKSN